MPDPFENGVLSDADRKKITTTLKEPLAESLKRDAMPMNEQLELLVYFRDMNGGDPEAAAQDYKEYRLQHLAGAIYDAWDATFSQPQWESTDITVMNPAVRTQAKNCKLNPDDFVTVIKHLMWTVGNVTHDDVMALIDPDSEDAVIDPHTAFEASYRVES